MNIRKEHYSDVQIPRLAIRLVVILLFCISTSSVSSEVNMLGDSSKSTDLIVDSLWLQKNLNSEATVIVDTREKEFYLEGHIEGAVNIPVESTFGNPPDNDLVAPISHIQDIFGNAGIDNGTQVILYDEGKYIGAARVFWVLEVYGHKHTAILDGGYSMWRKQGLPWSKEATKVTKRTFLPTIVPNVLSTKFSTRLAINDKSKTIIDARTSQEYLGKKSKTDKFGHIPSAINIPFYTNYAEGEGGRKLKTIESLAKNYANVDRDKKVITYCNRGKESALTYFILRRLGYNVSAYDGSWLEWSSDNSLPVNLPK